jgi:hypothetical protein
MIARTLFFRSDPLIPGAQGSCDWIYVSHT